MAGGKGGQPGGLYGTGIGGQGGAAGQPGQAGQTSYSPGGYAGTPGSGGSFPSGNGGNGGNDVLEPGGGGGGGGGSIGLITSNGLVFSPAFGGNGGNGGNGGVTPGSSYGDQGSAGLYGGGGGGGGEGGYGLELTGGGSVLIDTTVSGGAGGAGGASFGSGQVGSYVDKPGLGGNGGDGGAGVVLLSAGATIQNVGHLEGGVGGAAGSNTTSLMSASYGSGGDGFVGSGATLSNTGVIEGGGISTALDVNSATLSAVTHIGDGLSGTDLTISNTGTIEGGSLNWVGTVVSSQGGAQAIVGSDLTIVNGGTIAAGNFTFLGATTQGRYAIDLQSGSNELTSNTGSVISGGILVSTGATLTLVQSGNLTLSNTLAGAGTVVKDGLWTLTLDQTISQTEFNGELMINDGTVAAAAGDQVGAGVVALEGGELEVTAGGFVTAAIVNVGANSAIQVDTGTASLNGPVYLSGSAVLAKVGGGTLQINGAIHGDGTLLVETGTLAVTSSTGLASGTALIEDAATFEIRSSTAIADNLELIGRATVKVDRFAVATLNGLVSGTNPSDTLIVTGGGTLALESPSNTFANGAVISGGTLRLDGAMAGGGTPITFAASGATPATLVLGSGAQMVGGVFGSDLDDFVSGARLDLAGFSYASAPTIAYANGTLTVSDASGDTETFDFGSGTPLAGQVLAASDGNGGTLITACYVGGTLITAEQGDLSVADLRIGMQVLTAAGRLRPIRWIGRRSYAGRFLAANPASHPVRFTAGSLGTGLPRRDLLVSPEHAMFIDGILIPARCLMNGTTVVQERGLERVDYYHVELDSHDVLLAEGAPSESFVDDDSRGMFHNAAEWEAMYPGRDRLQAVFCAPRIESGFELEMIRTKLAGFSTAA